MTNTESSASLNRLYFSFNAPVLPSYTGCETSGNDFADTVPRRFYDKLHTECSLTSFNDAIIQEYLYDKRILIREKTENIQDNYHMSMYLLTDPVFINMYIN